MDKFFNMISDLGPATLVIGAVVLIAGAITLLYFFG
jgi:hypothetical protein